jgi:DNA gyrase subunit B
MTAEQNNTDEPIRSLSPLEHVRLRPGMYVGGIDARAMHHLVYEVLDHMVEEAFVGRCSHIWIELRGDNEISIRDNSMGLPIKLMSNGLTQMEGLLQIVGMGLTKSRLEPDVYQDRITGGLHGLGLWSVTALSEYMTIQNWRDGFLWEITYRQGLPQSPLSKTPMMNTSEAGTLFTFRPDYAIFDVNDFDRDILIARVRHLTYLNPGLSITLRDMRVDPGWEEKYASPAGLKQLIRGVQDATPLHEAIHIHQETVIKREYISDLRIGIEIAFQFSQGDDTRLYSYVNTVEIRDGGTHLTALKTALTRQFNSILRADSAQFSGTARFTWDEIFRGLTAVVSIRHPQPQFASPTRLQLGNQDIVGPISRVVSQAFKEQMDQQTVERLVMHYLSKRQPSE